jgi:hypothetical protein
VGVNDAIGVAAPAIPGAGLAGENVQVLADCYSLAWHNYLSLLESDTVLRSGSRPDHTRAGLSWLTKIKGDV